MLSLESCFMNFSAEYDLYVIVNNALKHHIPEDKFNLIVLNLGFKEAEKCYDLEPSVIGPLREQYDTVDFMVMNTYEEFENKNDLKTFFRFLPADIKEKPASKKNLVFYYRSDFFRTWAGKKQGRYVEHFFNVLKPFFSDEVDFIVTGDKDDHSFPSYITDQRVSAFNEKTDFFYNELFLNSILVAGVHGSNMLLPSLFSPMTIHLTSSSKLKNLGEEIINVRSASLFSLYENAYLVGNDALLSDISPAEMAFRTITLFSSFLEKEYKQQAIGDLLQNKKRFSQEEYIKSRHGYFHYEKAMKFRKEIVEAKEKKAWIKFHLYKKFRL
ncbi:MAG: hypothetical protein IAF38_23155 [Bacteroidia bacterium]|nr:hypothetical protein [Bacteroidia bacterium]